MERTPSKLSNSLREQQLLRPEDHIGCAAKSMGKENVSSSVVDVASLKRMRIATYYTLVRLQKAGEQKRKRKMEDLGRETEVGELAEMTEVKQEVVIDGVNPPNMVGETKPCTILETESKEYREEIENL